MEGSGVFGSRSNEDVFSSVFGRNCNIGVSRAGGSWSPDYSSMFGGNNTFVPLTGGDRPRKAAAIEKTLPCTLEDLYNGTTKKMKISRDVVGVSINEGFTLILVEYNSDAEVESIYNNASCLYRV